MKLKFIKNYKIFILVVIVVAAVLSFFVWLAIGGLEEAAIEGQIALIRVEDYISGGQPMPGITSSEEIAKFLMEARKNEDIKAVVLRINSPGGSPAAAEEIYREIVELKKNKPVVVSMADVAASAAYYLASGANKILALPSTDVGSIGVIAILPQFEDLLKKHGIQVLVLKTGDFKDLSFPFRGKTEEEKKIIQEELNDILNQFIERVAEGRGIDKEKVRELADGRTWTGRQAKELGLIDGFGGINEAFDTAARLAGIEKYEITEMREKRDLFEELLYGLPQSFSNRFVSLLYNLIYLRI